MNMCTRLTFNCVATTSSYLQTSLYLFNISPLLHEIIVSCVKTRRGNGNRANELNLLRVSHYHSLPKGANLFPHQIALVSC